MLFQQSTEVLVIVNLVHYNMEYENDDRYAQHRASLLARTTKLRKVEAKAVGYTELGYSAGGAASEMETNKSTVKTYHEKAIALYGFEILENKVLDDTEELPEYDRVAPDYFRNREDGREWVKIVLDQSESLPVEFVEDVKEAAMKHDAFPKTGE